MEAGLLSRRDTIRMAGLGLAFGATRPAAAQQPADRTLGRGDAPVTVQEWFSLNCGHCAHFSRTVFPRIRSELIDAGRVRYEFRDMPLNAIATEAAAAVRRMPPDQYARVVAALLWTQASWAYEADGDQTLQLVRQVALAGGDPAAARRDATDGDLIDDVTAEARQGHLRYGITQTPSFVFNGTLVAGEMSYDGFVAHVDRAAGGR